MNRFAPGLMAGIGLLWLTLWERLSRKDPSHPHSHGAKRFRTLPIRFNREQLFSGGSRKPLKGAAKEPRGYLNSIKGPSCAP
jgi:hypothetical protein